MQQPNRNSQPLVTPQASKRNSQTRVVSAGAPSPSTPAPSTQWASQRPADPSKSLFNLCTVILSKIERIGNLHTYIEACSYTEDPDDGMPPINLGVAPSGGRIDPVSQLWRVLRLGAPLCEILGQLDPRVNSEVLPPSQCTEIKTVKRLLYRFLQGCLGADLRPHLEHSMFTISNVFSDSTSDLLKVIKTLQIVLQLLVDRNVLPPSPLPRAIELPQPRTQRDQVVNELIQTERKYVQDLELMGDFAEAMLIANVPRETVQRIFPYLARLVDFQRRFLVGLEYHSRLPPHEQQFGSLFEIMRDEFDVYEGYTLNQREAAEAAQQEVANLIQFSDILEPYYELPNMLLKPVQRISKYPLLLRELIKTTPPEWESLETLEGGLEIMQDIMTTVNETQRRVECRFAFDELQTRVKSWHDISIDRLGELLLSGAFPVVERETETEYHLYLFENILLCCKDNYASKKGALKMRSRSSTGTLKKGTLDLKGRLYLSAVVATNVQKDANGFLLSITWGRGDAQETGHFDIRLYNEEQCQLWDNAIKRLLQTRAEYVPNTEDASPFYEDVQTPISSPVDAVPFRKLSVGSATDVRRSSAVSSSASSTLAGSRSSQPPPLLHTQSETTVHTLNSAAVTPPTPVQATAPAVQTAPETVAPVAAELTLQTTVAAAASQPIAQTTVAPASQPIAQTTAAVAPQLSVQTAPQPSAQKAPAASQPSVQTEAAQPSAQTAAPQSSAKQAPVVPQSAKQAPVVPHSSKQAPVVPQSSKQAPAASQSSAKQAPVASQSSAKQAPVAPQPTAQKAPVAPPPSAKKAPAPPQPIVATTAPTAGTSVPSTPTTPITPGGPITKVRIHYLVDSFVLLVERGIGFDPFLSKVERKIRLCGKIVPSPLRIKYKDEDEDYVVLNSDEDLAMAFECSSRDNELNLLIN